MWIKVLSSGSHFRFCCIYKTPLLLNGTHCLPRKRVAPHVTILNVFQRKIKKIKEKKVVSMQFYFFFHFTETDK